MTGQILIVGCGAIGGLFAAALSSGAKVTAFDANPEHVGAISAQGLRLSGKKSRTVRIEATGDPAALKGTAVRRRYISYQIENDGRGVHAAAAGTQRQSVAGPLQNGMGNAEVLLSVPNAIVVRGVTMNAGRASSRAASNG